MQFKKRRRRRVGEQGEVGFVGSDAETADLRLAGRDAGHFAQRLAQWTEIGRRLAWKEIAARCAAIFAIGATRFRLNGLCAAAASPQYVVGGSASGPATAAAAATGELELEESGRHGRVLHDAQRAHR